MGLLYVLSLPFTAVLLQIHVMLGVMLCRWAGSSWHFEG
jgi:hypothetical protein